MIAGDPNVPSDTHGASGHNPSQPIQFGVGCENQGNQNLHPFQESMHDPFIETAYMTSAGESSLQNNGDVANITLPFSQADTDFGFDNAWDNFLHFDNASDDLMSTD